MQPLWAPSPRSFSRSLNSDGKVNKALHIQATAVSSCMQADKLAARTAQCKLKSLSSPEKCPHGQEHKLQPERGTDKRLVARHRSRQAISGKSMLQHMKWMAVGDARSAYLKEEQSSDVLHPSHCVVLTACLEPE